jgi:hypothetical protein
MDKPRLTCAAWETARYLPTSDADPEGAICSEEDDIRLDAVYPVEVVPAERLLLR